MSYSNLIIPENTTVMVTGGAGFIGSNLCDALIKLGAIVICLDNFSNGKKENINHLFSNRNFRLIKGDICNFNKLLKVTKGVDYIFHEAAWGSVPRSISMPQFYELNNVSGTLNVFEAAKRNGIKKVIYASSSSVYGDSEVLPKKEGAEGKLLSPYALTKRTDEEYGRLYYKLYGLPTIGLRYFNVFGKRQDPNGQYAAVIPLFVKACINKELAYINGDGSYSRDFTYVENVVEANLKAAFCSDEKCYGETFNIAYGGRVTINELFDSIASLLGSEQKPIYRDVRKGDIPHSNADISKARNGFGYDPSYSFNDGIKLAIDWYKDYFSK